MNERENFIRTIEMTGPEWVPCAIIFAPGTWQKYRDSLQDVVDRHQGIFGRSQKGSIKFDQKGSVNFDELPPLYRTGQDFVDTWGCTWHNPVEGLKGLVIPPYRLADYSALDSYQAPDPLTQNDWGPIDFNEIESAIAERKQNGIPAEGSLEDSARFLERLFWLRGFESVMEDIILAPPEFDKLMDLVQQHNVKVIEKWLQIGVDIIWFRDDIAAQDRLMFSPKHFRQYLMPRYTEMFQPCRTAKTHAAFKSDGHIMEIVDDLIECGFDTLGVTQEENGLENLRDNCKGRVCLEVQVNREQILPYGTVQDVKDHIKELISVLGSKDGGLIIGAWIMPDTPLENIEALCQAIEDYRYY